MRGSNAYQGAYGGGGGGTATTPGGSNGQVQYNNAGSFGGATGITIAAGTVTAFNAVGGTVTASAPIYQGSQTWNSGAVTFDGITENITDTASATNSRWLRLTRNSTDWFAIQKSAFADVVLQMRRTGDSGANAVYMRGGVGQLNFGFGAHTSQERISFASDYTALALSSIWKVGFCSAAALGGGSSNPDSFFMRGGGAAAIQMGENHATTATNQTLKAHSVTTGTGANLILSGGTGSVANGVVIISALPTANPGPGILWNNAGTPAIGT